MKQSLIVGIDPGGQRLSYSVFDAVSEQLLHLRSVTCNVEERLRPFEIVESFLHDLRSIDIDENLPAYYIEQPFGKFITGIVAVERTNGALLYALNPDAMQINVSTWKKATEVKAIPKELRRKRDWKSRRDAAVATLKEPESPFLTAKDMIRVRYLELYPHVGERTISDEYDACLIGLAGLLINNGKYVE